MAIRRLLGLVVLGPSDSCSRTGHAAALVGSLAVLVQLYPQALAAEVILPSPAGLSQ